MLSGLGDDLSTRGAEARIADDDSGIRGVDPSRQQSFVRQVETADAGILVDVSEVDGASAAVLVVHSAAGRTAWAVDRSCTTGNTGLIRGPVPLR